LKRDDPRLGSICGLLTEWKLSPWLDRSRQPLRNEYDMRYDREYDHNDLSECAFLELTPPQEAGNYGAMNRGPGPEGEVIFPQAEMPGGVNNPVATPHADGFDFMYGMYTWIFVPLRVKTILESGNLRGLKFRRANFAPQQTKDDEGWDDWERKYGIPYWELDSDCTMPPLSPSMPLWTSDKEPAVGGDYSKGLLRLDGLYSHAELHYRSSELARLPPFDLARTFESFGNKIEYDRFDCPLVASQRFYRFCIERGLNTGWTPVRIDPD
jgi:hypothetical protein